MRSFISFPVTEHDALLVLNAINGFGIKRIRSLIGRFGSAAEALRAPLELFLDFPGLPQASRVNLQSFSAQAFLEKDRKACERAKARALTFLDADYPEPLKDLADPPPVIYVCGAFPERLDCSVAIVGSRRATHYGRHAAERFGAELAELGIPVVSGLALGVDTAAHEGALRAGGSTVAVIGSGLDIIYPPENRDLFHRICHQGCVISEFSFGTQPFPAHFPRRNRIVSGLSLGVVVIEAGVKSGALITAGFALEQGREVFVVPGRIDSDLSDGTHALMKQGAKPILTVKDILEDLPLRVLRQGLEGEQGIVRGLSGDERVVFELIREGVATYEEIEGRTGFGPTTLMAVLLALELCGRIKQKPGRSYVIT